MLVRLDRTVCYAIVKFTLRPFRIWEHDYYGVGIRKDIGRRGVALAICMPPEVLMTTARLLADEPLQYNTTKRWVDYLVRTALNSTNQYALSELEI